MANDAEVSRYNIPGHVFWLMAILAVAPLPSLVANKYNYTWSLLIFVLPIATILIWFFRNPKEEIGLNKKAFYVTLVLLVASGAVLNLFFADDFFEYPNTDAVLGVSVPALDFFSIDWQHPIPLEEFGFYIFGFLAMLLVYIWGDLEFFRAYRKDPDESHSKRLIQLSWKSVGVVVALLLVGTGIKQTWGGGGFPGYLAYLLFVPFLVTVLLFRTSFHRINWRAYMFMFMMMLGWSVTWEVSLALPGGWWAYQSEPMMGLHFERWSDIPVEAIIVWFLAALATTVTFEAARIFFRMERPYGKRFFKEGT